MKKALFSIATIVFLCGSANGQGQQIISTIAGDGLITYTGDGEQATNASLYNPLGVAADAAGNVYISDTKHHCIRKVNTAGIITTITGNGTEGSGGDGGMAIDARIKMPSKVAVDGSGNVYFVDNGNHRLRKINPSGIITTIAGNGTEGNSGDGGLAIDASINPCAGLAIDRFGNIYFGDLGVHTIRKINTSGVITTVAGSGVSGYGGDDGPATNAKLNEPFGLDVDHAGNIYVAEYRNNCIRKISSTGIISTIAGNTSIGFTGYSGDGEPATSAKLNRPFDVVADNFGNLFFADNNNHVIRKINGFGIITTIAGVGTNSGNGAEGIPATSALIRDPTDVAISAAGELLLADYGNNKIRKVTNAVSVKDKRGLVQAFEIKTYPNPNNGYCSLYISAPGKEDVEIMVTNIEGRNVYRTTGITNTAIPLTMDVPSGIYIATCAAPNAVLSTTISVLK